jgi:hypothetical protein
MSAATRLRLSIIALLLLAPLLASAAPLLLAPFGCTLDLPEGWVPVSTEDPSRLSFSDPGSGAMLQCGIFTHDPDLGAEALGKDFSRQLSAKEKGAAFEFSGRDAYLSRVDFSSAGTPFKGFLLVVSGLHRGSSPADEDALLVAFVPAESFDRERDSLASALDSFSPDEEGRLLPGPVSQSISPFPAHDLRKTHLVFLGGIVEMSVGRGEAEATQGLIEREARVLVAYRAGHRGAWQRYYRMIYRDNYHRLDGVFAGIRKRLREKGVAPGEYPVELLSWIQGFSYVRTGTLSDFLSPVSAVLSASGDCDSLAILYAALLDHLGIDAILFVSTHFSHALAGVDISRPGATLDFEGRKYLVAEMTERVSIGLIAQDMADASAWIPMRLRETRAERLGVP